MSLPVKSGFTIIEVMVVMTVIAVLATMVLYGLGKSQESARDASRMQIMNGVQLGLERYYGDKQAYPANQVFGSMMMSPSPNPGLVTAGYLAEPVDPKKSCTTGPVVGLEWAPCGGTRPRYQYQPLPAGCVRTACQGFELILDKESGGSVTLTNPQ